MKKKVNYWVLTALLIVPYGAWASLITCPVQPLNALQSIAVFDGDPHDNVELAPEPANQNNGQWKYLDTIYKQKRNITVRCQYKNNLILDVAIVQKITACRSSDKAGVLTMVCN